MALFGLDMLEMPLNELELRIDVHNCLQKGGCITLGDLLALTPSEALRLPSLGPKRLDDIEQVLAGMGLRLTDYVARQRLAA